MSLTSLASTKRGQSGLRILESRVNRFVDIDRDIWGVEQIWVLTCLASTNRGQSGLGMYSIIAVTGAAASFAFLLASASAAARSR